MERCSALPQSPWVRRRTASGNWNWNWRWERMIADLLSHLKWIVLESAIRATNIFSFCNSAERGNGMAVAVALAVAGLGWDWGTKQARKNTFKILCYLEKHDKITPYHLLSSKKRRWRRRPRRLHSHSAMTKKIFNFFSIFVIVCSSMELKQTF